MGLCPFHKERTPSFHVSDERGYYHCFGCQASGDVFRYLQEQEGLTFLEAVQKLGDRFGIEVKDDLTEAERRERFAQKKKEEVLFQVSALAATYFEEMLRSHPDARLAHEELARRQLAYEGEQLAVLQAFRIGFAPDSWDGLESYLRKKGADLRAAEAVGLLAPRKQGSGYYDRFRHRLMFAVLDLNGKIVAFSGRALPPTAPLPEGAEAPAKYINSPESPIYRKRETVFGLYQARSALRSGRPCVLVEGNFDVVSLHAHGISAAVAPLGTAFTEEQGRLIRRFTQDVVVLFDGDAAGRKATAACREPSQKVGLSARVAMLPLGTDPDEFVRKQGATALSTVLDRARGMLDHLITEVLDERFVNDDAETRAKKIDAVLQLLRTESDPSVLLMAQQYADQLATTLASRLGVADVRTFDALVGSVRRAAHRTHAAPRTSDQVQLAPPMRARSRERTHEIELSIVGALLDYPSLVDSEELLAYGDSMQGDLAVFVVAYSRLLRERGREKSGDLPAAVASTTGFVDSLLAKIPESVRPFVSERLAAPRHVSEETAKKELAANLQKLHQQHLDRLEEITLVELEKARQVGDFEKELVLLQEQAERARARRRIK